MSSSPPQSLFMPQEEYLRPSFVYPDDDKHVCIRCKEILRPPVQMLSCGHRMCQLCLMDCRQSGADKQCPGGEEECQETDIFDDQHIFPDKGTERELKKLLVHCKNKQYGCTEQPMWSKLEAHIKECPFKPIYCPNAENGCQQISTIKNIEKHKTKCLYTMEQCIYCSQYVTKKEMDEGHEKECASKPKECQFKSMGCKFTGFKEEMDNHAMTTGLNNHIELLFSTIQQLKSNEDSVKNELKQFKSDNTNLRKELDKVKKDKTDLKQQLDKKVQNLQKMTGQNSEKVHELGIITESAKKIPDLESISKNHESRIKTLETSKSSSHITTELENKIKAVAHSTNAQDYRLSQFDVKFQCLESTAYDSVLVWKINDYSRRKRDALDERTVSLYSQPFYTSRFGYKMCVRIYLNGDGMGKGSHISLFFVIMKGEYDALLPWPFRQKVTLTLMDQSSGRKHLSDAFKPDPISTSFKRPVSDMNVASGCPLFAGQSVVETDTYLKDNTIFIKVDVDKNGLDQP